MDGDAVRKLLEGQSPHVEWKESYRNKEEIYRAVAAFANDLSGSGEPGHVLIGVDRRGTVIGLPWASADERDKGLQELAGLFRQIKIVPNPSVDVEALEVGGKVVAVLRVSPYAVPSVVKVDGVAWVRVGTTTQRATEADLARLEERRPENALPFDRRVVAAATLDDLDLASLRATWLAAREGDVDHDTFPAFEAWLSLEDVVRRTPRGWSPTVTGILLHGLDPQTWLPGAAIDFVRYDGITYEAQPILRKRATGTLGRQLDTAWAQLEALNAAVPTAPDGIKQGFAEMYPREVLKELTRNLVQHRRYDQTNAPGRISWFDDRIEFNNPGGPFGAASEGTFGDHSDYRNPTITQGLVEQGYVQRLGRGVRVARLVLARAGHPDLRVETDGYTIVTVFRRP